MKRQNDWLRQIRTAQALTQQECADRCGISRAYYTNLEQGKRGSNLAGATAQKIAAALDFPWTWFYDDAQRAREWSQARSKAPEDK